MTEQDKRDVFIRHTHSIGCRMLGIQMSQWGWRTSRGIKCRYREAVVSESVPQWK